MNRRRRSVERSWRAQIALAAERVERRLGRPLQLDEWERFQLGWRGIDYLRTREVCSHYPHVFAFVVHDGRLTYEPREKGASSRK